MSPLSRSVIDDRLSEYWDGVGVRASDAEIDRLSTGLRPELIESIAELRERDDARLPSQEFLARMEEHIGKLSETGSQLPDASSGEHVLASVIVFPSPRITTESAGATSRRTLAALAAVAVLALALVAAYVEWESRGTNSGNAGNVIPAPLFSADVTTDRGNAHRTGVMPGPSLASDPETRWQFGAGTGRISAAVIAADTIYVANGYSSQVTDSLPGRLYAISAKSGEEIWQFSMLAGGASAPVVVDGVVYAADTAGNLYAIQSGTGTELWRTNLDGRWVSSPAVSGDTLYVATTPFRVTLQVALSSDRVFVGSGLLNNGPDQTMLYALDTTDGSVRWVSADFPSDAPGITALDAASGETAWRFPMVSLEVGPVFSEQVIYAGSSVEGTLFAIDARNGVQRWESILGEDLPVDSSPVVVDERVILNTAFGQTIALDARSGDEVWRQAAQHRSFLNSPVFAGEEVIVVDVAGGVSAYSIDDGAVLWTDQIATTGQVEPSPMMAGGVLYVGSSLSSTTGHTARLWALADNGGDEDSQNTS